MALVGVRARPFLGLGRIGCQAAAELIGLPEIELRVGVTVFDGAAPPLDRGGIVTPAPGIDACFHLVGGRRRLRCGGGEHDAGDNCKSGREKAGPPGSCRGGTDERRRIWRGSTLLYTHPSSSCGGPTELERQ